MSHPRKLVRDELIDDQFRLVSQLGKGGMGTVWAADDLTLGRPVAIKFLSQEFLHDQQARLRFAREPRLASKIRSPHVVQVFAQGTTEDDVPYLVMELLEGEDLASRVSRDGPCALAEAGAIVEQICRALGRAHREGLVHRDIKPHNIFLTPESDGQLFVKLLDFGIAKDASARITGLTLTGEVVGSALYVSPEQLHEASSVGPSTDIWSLGVVIYEMLTGRVPFEGRSLPELFMRVVEGNYQPISQLGQGLPKALDTFFERVIKVDPSQRFQTVDELAAAFGRIVRANSSGLLLKQDTPRALPAREYAGAEVPAVSKTTSETPSEAALVQVRAAEQLPRPWPRAILAAAVLVAIVAAAYALRLKRETPAVAAPALVQPAPAASPVEQTAAPVGAASMPLAKSTSGSTSTDDLPPAAATGLPIGKSGSVSDAVHKPKASPATSRPSSSPPPQPMLHNHGF
jgi:serine/threonine protein kinase